jgi:NAD+ diphosphatase
LFGREIGVPDGRSCWAAEVAPGVEPPEGSVFRDLRGLFFGMGEDVFRTTGRAKQIVGWNATHRFCGRCGGQTEPVPGELARKCMRCGMLHYPPTTLA